MFYKYDYFGKEVLARLMAEERRGNKRARDILGLLKEDVKALPLLERAAKGAIFPWHDYLCEAVFCYSDGMDYAAIAMAGMSLEALLGEEILREAGEITDAPTKTAPNAREFSPGKKYAEIKTKPLGFKIEAVKKKEAAIADSLERINAIRNEYVHRPNDAAMRHISSATDKAAVNASAKIREDALDSLRCLLVAVAYFGEK
ncbi:Uncharacterised protein [Candidatus Norongarragalina meridionalis]|nr:Uncharacterised protein [Candidatus Norongarragalina meridionalis]